MILWKRGVLTRGKFAQHALHREAAHTGWWPFSYRILQELEHDFTADDEPLLERLYQSLAAGAGVFKITRRNRFTAFDAEVAERVRTAFPNAEPLVVHDMGASNAITALELYQTLRTVRSVALTASDYFDTLTLVTLDEGRWTVAFDSANRSIQTTGWGTVFSNRTYPWRYALNRMAQWWVQKQIVPHAAAVLAQGPSDAVSQIPLFHPEALALARREANFRLCKHDIFQPNPVRSHIVRAMNVITPQHFSSEQAQAAIRASVSNLVPGGWLILGRSIDEEDGRLRATVYQWNGETLEPLRLHHEGYEWPELVADLTHGVPTAVG